jgi:tRNA(Ile)-lysidine synthase
MTPEGNEPKKRVVVAAVSGGPDSVYLLLGKLAREKGTRIIIGHVNYGTRGIESEKDQIFVEKLGKSCRYETAILVSKEGNIPGESRRATGTHGRFPAGFEKKARDIRYRFLKVLSGSVGADAIALAHTADDQIETILMRIFEGAGIGGLKGIPRETGDGIVRPILDVWKEDILDYLKKRKIPFRIDRSNVDTRFERNWIRRILIPLLEDRYGKGVKKRIFTLGERLRELDDYLEGEAGGWIQRNVGKKCDVLFRRKSFSALPSVLRVKILQRICFDRLRIAPNERLLKSMDAIVSGGGPSAQVNAGNGWKLVNRYEEALFVPGGKGRDRKSTGLASGEKMPIRIPSPGEYKIPLGRQGRIVSFAWESRGKRSPAQAKRLAAYGNAEVFDAAELTLPLAVRPLRAGDRILPFGGSVRGNALDGRKKVKELLIDRKIPRDERWGRPVVCDAADAILWIPGVLRSALAPVTPATRKTAILRIRSAE